jgi:hypothetical protein
MLELLSPMKSRGLSFEHAWRASFQRIKWPHDKQSRNEWKEALEQTQGVWSDCYHDAGNRLDIEALIEYLASPR